MVVWASAGAAGRQNRRESRLAWVRLMTDEYTTLVAGLCRAGDSWPLDDKPVSVSPCGAAVILLDRPLLDGSSDLPGSGNGAGRSSSPIWSCSTWGLPCRRPLPEPRCALTAPFHPYPAKYTPGGIVFCGTFRKTRFKRIPPAVSRHVALWRPDFPPARFGFLRLPRATVHPASSAPIIESRRTRPQAKLLETLNRTGASPLRSCILLIQGAVVLGFPS